MSPETLATSVDVSAREFLDAAEHQQTLHADLPENLEPILLRRSTHSSQPTTPLTPPRASISSRHGSGTTPTHPSDSRCVSEMGDAS